MEGPGYACLHVSSEERIRIIMLPVEHELLHSTGIAVIPKVRTSYIIADTSTAHSFLLGVVVVRCSCADAVEVRDTGPVTGVRTE